MNVIETSTRNQIIIDLQSKLIDNRILFINSVINRELAGEIQSALLYLSSKSKEPISIYINSPGGSVYDGLAIYDVIRHVQNQGIEVKTYAVGLAASMAAILLISGTRRYSLPNSTIMLHSVSSFTSGKVEEIKVDYEETQRLQNKLLEIVKEKASDEAASLCGNLDKYLSPEEAQKLNIIHEIL
jgi:ATP-dependent Clp protease protease subunit